MKTKPNIRKIICQKWFRSHIMLRIWSYHIRISTFLLPLASISQAVPSLLSIPKQPLEYKGWVDVTSKIQYLQPFNHIPNNCKIKKKTCLARSSRSRLPGAKKGESGPNLRRSGFQNGNPNCWLWLFSTSIAIFRLFTSIPEAILFPLSILNWIETSYVSVGLYTLGLKTPFKFSKVNKLLVPCFSISTSLDNFF